MKNRILQAYRQAPWRIQLQWIGLFLLALVLIAAIAGVYLNISAQAATAGRNIQFIENDIDQIENEISEFTAELAQTKSSVNLKQKAEALGFHRMKADQAVYLEIPGFNPEKNLVLAPPRRNLIVESPVLRPSYRDSLWDLFLDQIWPSGDSALDKDGEGLP